MGVNGNISRAALRRRLIRKAEAGDVDAMMEYCSTYPDIELASAGRDEQKRVLRYRGDTICSFRTVFGREYGEGMVVPRKMVSS